MSHSNLSTTSDGENGLSPRLLTADACAAHYGFFPAHWLRLVDAGKAPRPVKLGRLVRWEIRVLEERESTGCPPIRHTKGGTNVK